MGVRRKPATSEPATVSVRMLASELQQAHNWAAGTPEANAWVAERVEQFAVGLGLSVQPFWLPTLTADEARRLMAAVLEQRDPIDEAEKRDAERDRDQLLNDMPSPSELVGFFGDAVGRLGADVIGRAVTPSEAWGPADAPGPLRRLTAERDHEIVKGSVYVGE